MLVLDKAPHRQGGFVLTAAVSQDSHPGGGRRVLVIEDEVLIGMLLEDMLTDLGYAIAGTASRLDEATGLARTADFDLAILDVNLNGRESYPVAEILAERGIPFMFATGYGERGMPSAFQNRPTLQKPFQLESLQLQLRQLDGAAT
jgi:CheY-like chemotaxis protein